MEWSTHPVTHDRFEDFGAVINPIPRLVRSTKIHPVDDVPVWSIICVVVRRGHRKKGVTRHLIEGAVDFAASHGAPAVEAYPVDPGGRRMDLTMAFVGTRSMFERAAVRHTPVDNAEHDQRRAAMLER